MKQHWWQLTDEEADRLNPPILNIIEGGDGDLYVQHLFHPDWQPVGHVPAPRTRLGWFLYHLIHGLVMRYPLHKVIGFALMNTKVSDDVEVVGDDDERWR
jgi:hypothetical protein